MKNQVRELWSRGDAAFGTFLVIPSIRSAEVVGKAGFDWVVIEQQHGAVAQESLLPILHALELGGTTTWVRPRGSRPAARAPTVASVITPHRKRPTTTSSASS
jgi:4-hydroxy-2-oxoheptanedioate aldolase